ncbi:hypothetical protein LTR53_006154 [Teratosphaeriaceae sp. CCFEE 6253]|nr:hypothetical protein LTR53_006154 [Teratosphaeriaceae sp. CCFEE 6253]
MVFDITERTEAEGDDYPYSQWYDIDTATGGYPSGDIGANGFLQLYDTGCMLGDGWNCTAACLDTTAGPAILWNTSNYGMYTMQNCVVLPVIAALLAANNLTPGSVKLAAKYQIQANAGLVNDSMAGWPVINNCMNEYCDGNSESVPGCNTDQKFNDDIVKTFRFMQSKKTWDSYMNGDIGANQVNFTFNGTMFNSGICKNLNAVINGDIGGIGMFISYLMQMFIVLSAWILFHFYETWAAWPLTAILMPLHGTRKASQLAQQVQNSIRASKHTAALVAALDEFQKAQIFFMLAVQIAALIALHNPNYIQASS